MKYFLLTIMCYLTLNNLQSQTSIEKQIKVGDWVFIKDCKKSQKEFESMDVYARTTEFNKSKVDTLSGNGLLDAFFNDKSIDAKRLPCSMGGRKYKIAAYHEFVKEGITHRVILLHTKYPLTLIWVELDVALKMEEIVF